MLMVSRPTADFDGRVPKYLVEQLSLLLLGAGELTLLQCLYNGTPQSMEQLPDLHALFDRQESRPTDSLTARWVQEIAPGRVAALARTLVAAADIRIGDSVEVEAFKLTHGYEALEAVTGERSDASAYLDAMRAVKLVTTARDPADTDGLRGRLVLLREALIYNAGMIADSLLDTVRHGREQSMVTTAGGISAPSTASTVLDSVTSFLNHSCWPSCEVMLVNGVLALKAARALAAGEELTLSYAAPALDWPAPQRRAVLQSWGFRCSCSRCLGEDALGPELDVVLQRCVRAMEAHGLFDGSVQSMDSSICPALQALRPLERAALRAELLPACRALLDAADAQPQQQRLLVLGAGHRALAMLSVLLMVECREGAVIDVEVGTRAWRARVELCALTLPVSEAGWKVTGAFCSWAMMLGSVGAAAAVATLMEADQGLRAALVRRYGPGLDDATEEQLLKAARACTSIFGETWTARMAARAGLLLS